MPKNTLCTSRIGLASKALHILWTIAGNWSTEKISFNTVELTVVCQITSYFKVSNGLCVWNSRGGWKKYQKLIVGGGGGGTVGGGKYWEF